MEQIVWNFYGNPEHSHKFIYQLGDWGPIEAITDMRYFDGDEFWLWEKKDEYCEVCGDDASYPEDLLTDEALETTEDLENVV